MCIVSNIGTGYQEAFPKRWPAVMPPAAQTVVWPGVSQADFDALKAEVEALKELLKAAKQFDDATGQADCEMDEKVEFIKQLADHLGVDLDEVFG